MTNEDEDNSLLFEEQQDTTSWPIPRLFWEYGGEHRRLIMVALLASVLGPVASLLPTYLLKVVIDGVFLGTTAFSLPIIPTEWLPSAQRTQLFLSVGLLLGAAVVSTVFGWVSSWAWGRFAQTVQHAVRTDAYEKIQRLSVTFFND